MNKKFMTVVFLVAFAFSATTAPAADSEDVSSEKDPEKVLARVEGHEIREKDVDQLLVAAGPQAAMIYNNEPGRRMVLDELIAVRLFALSGKKQELDDTPEFKSSLDNFITQFLAMAAIENTMKDITVSDEECKKFYDENLDNFTTPEQIQARHILLADDVTSGDKIALIREELEKGVSFEVLAAEHSIDPSAQQNGGDLGFFSKGRMVPEFEEAAFALREPGDISEPVKSNFGWHLIKLEGKMASSVLSYDEVKPQIEQNISSEKMSLKYREELDALKEEYTVEILTE